MWLDWWWQPPTPAPPLPLCPCARIERHHRACTWLGVGLSERLSKSCQNKYLRCTPNTYITARNTQARATKSYKEEGRSWDCKKKKKRPETKPKYRIKIRLRGEMWQCVRNLCLQRTYTTQSVSTFWGLTHLSSNKQTDNTLTNIDKGKPSVCLDQHVWRANSIKGGNSQIPINQRVLFFFQNNVREAVNL